MPIQEGSFMFLVLVVTIIVLLPLYAKLVAFFLGRGWFRAKLEHHRSILSDMEKH